MTFVTSDDVVSILSFFEELDDPRSTINRKHLLGDLIVICICGVLAGGGLSLSPDLFFQQMIALCREPLFLFGVLFYGAAAIVWFAALSLENLTTGYPILVGLTFVMVGLGAAVVFGEMISLQKLTGMAAILVGIALIARA